VKREKALQLAKSKAEEAEKRVKNGEKIDAAARALGLTEKPAICSPQRLNRRRCSGKQLAAAFQMKQGELAPS